MAKTENKTRIAYDLSSNQRDTLARPKSTSRQQLNQRAFEARSSTLRRPKSQIKKTIAKRLQEEIRETRNFRGARQARYNGAGTFKTGYGGYLSATGNTNAAIGVGDTVGLETRGSSATASYRTQPR